MKRLLFISFMLLGIGQTVSFAQSNDDIYFNSSDLEQQKKEDRKNEKEARKQSQYQDELAAQNQGQGQYSDDDYQSYNKSYDNDGYIDYDNDDYYYATHFRRFNQPFYNMGYYSTFYNPYWYNPYWYDPYWGWSAWNRPGVSISIGMGGPYWSSYWGWYNWYGYGGFGSCWGYPMYGNWFGSPYYSGYWNGYYAGIYGGGSGYIGYRNITYGPRNSTNFAYNTGFRGASGAVRREATGQRLGLRTTQLTTNGMNERPARTMNANVNPDRNQVIDRTRGAGQQRMETERNNAVREQVLERPNNAAGERPARGQFSREEAAPAYNENRGVERNERPAYDGNRMPDRNDRPVYQNNRTQERQQYNQPRQMEQRSYEQPRQQRSFEQQRSAPTFERQRSTPTFERSMPSRSMPSAPSRSMPSGGGGGNFGGGRRR